MARRLHDLTEESENLARLKGTGNREVSRTPPCRPIPLSGIIGRVWKFATPLAIVIGIALALVGTEDGRFMASTLWNKMVNPMTDARAQALVSAAFPQLQNPTSDHFRSVAIGVIALNAQMRACARSWPEFEDLSHLTGTLLSAVQRVGELKAVITETTRAELQMIQSNLDAYQRNGFLSPSTEEDYSGCLLTAQVYRAQFANLL